MKLASILISICVYTLCTGSTLAQSPTTPVKTFYNVDWNERLAPNLGMKPHDEGLLGDQIDLHTGRLGFEQVDVSLPGNSHLPVEVRRKLNPSQWQNNAFVDWQLDIPRISTNINGSEFYGGVHWGKKRCTEPLVNAIPQSNSPLKLDSSAQPLRPNEYNNGVILDVPGIVSTAVLDKSTTAAWPAAAQKVTAKGWYLTCIPNIDGSGTEGFYAFSPEGDKYKFDVQQVRWTSSTDLWRVYSVDLVKYAQESTHIEILAVSEVTDINGNWVRYSYDSSSRLITINSNDGRALRFEYGGSASSSVSSVVANPGRSDERRWGYTYGTQYVSEWAPPSKAYDQPITKQALYYTLKSVTHPRWTDVAI